VITEIKAILQETVEERCPEVVVVRSKAAESEAIMGRKFPLVSLITNPGSFDDREAKTFRYYDEAEQQWKQRYIRGNRMVPILLRCWALGEEETDRLFSRILPAIPRKWRYDEFEGLVLIEGEEHSDYTDRASKLYVSVADIRFMVDVALEAEEVPTITETAIEAGANRL
jgi:hypothetical protein